MAVLDGPDLARRHLAGRLGSRRVLRLAGRGGTLASGTGAPAAGAGARRWAFAAFVGAFLGGVEAWLAAAGDFAGGMVGCVVVQYTSRCESACSTHPLPLARTTPWLPNQTPLRTPRTQSCRAAGAGTHRSKPLFRGRMPVRPLHASMSIRTFPRRLMAVLAVLIVGVLFAFALRAWRRSGAEEYRTFASPDGRFQIVVYRIPSRVVMPGQGSDASGYFQLRDARTGRVLRESCVEMVQLVERVEWSPTNVRVQLLADWSLPQ